MEALFGNVISVYSREDAIRDGVLVEVPQGIAKESGIRIPVAATAELWNTVIVPDEPSEALGDSIDGRLWDVLWMFTLKARASKNESVIFFDVIAKIDGKDKLHKVKAVIGPGDNWEPVLTIMMPHED